MSYANVRRIGAQVTIELSNALSGWRQSSGPLHERLAEALAAAAKRQDLLPGSRLPPERVLATHLGVARATVSAAYEQLQVRGLVQRRQGRGTHIVSPDGGATGGLAAELVTSLQRNMLFRHLGDTPPDAVDLLAGYAPPGPSLVQALATATDEADLGELIGGPTYLPVGYPPLRRAIAAHLSGQGLATAAEQILVTGGAQQAMSLLTSCYLTPGAMVLTEDPTYPGAIDAFRTAGARILTVPVRSTGADVRLAAATLSEAPVQLVYLMPTFHNPTGCVMPEPARQEIARLSRVTGIPVIEDLTLADLALGSEPPPPLAAWTGDAGIVSIGSLSKLCWSGLRVGWIRAPEPVIAQLGRIKAVTDLGTSFVSQAIAAELLGQAVRIKDVRRRELSARLDLLDQLMHRHLPDWKWRRPPGGLWVWAQLPDGSSAELAQIARKHGVLIGPGTVWSPTGRFDDHIRLPFDIAPDSLEQGIRCLSHAWHAYRGKLNGPAYLDVVV